MHGLVHVKWTTATGLLLLPPFMTSTVASNHLLTHNECFSLPDLIHLVELYLLSHCGVYVLQRTESRYPIFALVIVWPGLIRFFLLLFSNLPSQVSPFRRLISQAAWVSLFILEKEQLFEILIT